LPSCERLNVLVSAGGTPAALAAKAASTTIPILFVVGADPVKLGLVASLNRPGGNVTGVNLFANVVGSKQLELLHELVPAPAVIGFLVNPITNLAESDTEEIQATATTLGRKLLIVHARTENEVDQAFSTMIEQGVKALLVEGDPFFNNRKEQFVALAARYALPTIYQFPIFVAAGGLMSYGSSISDSYRQVGHYARRILKGEKPPSRSTIDQVRTDNQSQDREGARPHSTSLVARPRRRSDRVTPSALLPANGARQHALSNKKPRPKPGLKTNPHFSACRALCTPSPP
jgi:putative ABC transport system substrate-binding protein